MVSSLSITQLGSHWYSAHISAVLLPFVLWGINHHQTSAVGDDLAHGLGVPVGFIRWYHIFGVLPGRYCPHRPSCAFVARTIAVVSWRVATQFWKHLLARRINCIVVLADFVYGEEPFPVYLIPHVGILTGAMGAALSGWRAESEGRRK